MSKYIDAEKLKYEIERRNLSNYHTTTEGYEEELYEIIDSLQQEQLEVLSGEDVMVMCNQILIDWVKEGNTQEEKEQREQAHIRFFELYDNYLMQEQPEVDLEKEVVKYFQGYWPGMKTPEACNHQMVFTTPAIMRMIEHFYELGLNARKEK